MIEECRGMEYEERLATLGLTTLELRSDRADLIQVYKIMCEKEEGDSNIFFQEAKGGGKGHRYKLFKKRFCRDVGRFSFGNRIYGAWNSLPDGVVEANSLNGIKRGLDLHLRTTRGLK